jgi:hypothetical protein
MSSPDATLLLDARHFPMLYRPSPSRFMNAIVVGTGDATRSRLRPALHYLRREVGLQRLLYLDLHDRPPFDLAPDEHYRAVVGDSRVPVAELNRLEFTGPDTLAVVAVPTGWHLPYARQLARLVGRVAVEKPLTRDLADAERLAGDTVRPLPMSHFLFKEPMRRWLDTCRRQGPSRLERFSAIRIDLLERKAVGGRQIDPSLWDLGWHALECVLAPYRAAGLPVTLEIDAVFTAGYSQTETEPDPPADTAARIAGRLYHARAVVPFDLRMGKGLDTDRKSLTYRVAGQPDLVIDLSETGRDAHQRLLAELLTQAEPDLGLGLDDAIDLVRLCDRAERMATVEPSYRFGRTPAFLTDEVPSAALLGLYF